ncbi:MAG: ABC transporter permease, partial [Muribaculaceae bacterium]|nr:ABC transporter permease [Muribaculaceae bacterium]
GPRAEFSQEEVSEIAAQPWAEEVGTFTASAFSVYASVELASKYMSTALFFESIPDEFFDVKPSDWTFDPAGSTTIPIIIPKDYLALYNFGFAASKGLPQISEEMVQMIPINIRIGDNFRHQAFTGRIVGFSSRLNTIAVPESFMQWANAQYATTPIAMPSRLIVKAHDPGDKAMIDYIENHEYEIAGNALNSGKIMAMLSLVTVIVVVVGIVISLLAFFILLLSIHLLLQKNREKLRNLMLLGYTSAEVARYYHLLVASINATVLIVALIVVSVVRLWWLNILQTISEPQSGMTLTIMLSILAMILITAFNLNSISRHTRDTLSKK